MGRSLFGMGNIRSTEVLLKIDRHGCQKTVDRTIDLVETDLYREIFTTA